MMPPGVEEDVVGFRGGGDRQPTKEQFPTDGSPTGTSHLSTGCT